MKVGFNARLLADSNLRGWNRYTVNLLAQLPALGIRPVLYGQKPLHASHLARLQAGSFEVRIRTVRPYALWEQVWLPFQCARDGVSLLHAPANFGLPRMSRCPRVLTLHDAVGPGTSLRSRIFHATARECAQRVITVSDHAREEIVARLGVTEARIRVIPEAADPNFSRPVTAEDRQRVWNRHAITAPYFFYVGGWEDRKNLPFLLEAFKAADVPGVKIVVAGGLEDERLRLLYAEALGDRLHLLGWIEEPDLPALYAESLAFVYPSKHEGFGLQLCEAMAVGCPILAARATSLPEVLGDGGLTFSLDAIDELVVYLRRVAQDSGFREALITRSRSRSTDFSWRKAAEATVAVYKEVVQASSSS